MRSLIALEELSMVGEGQDFFQFEQSRSDYIKGLVLGQWVRLQWRRIFAKSKRNAIWQVCVADSNECPIGSGMPATQTGVKSREASYQG